VGYGAGKEEWEVRILRFFLSCGTDLPSTPLLSPPGRVVFPYDVISGKNRIDLFPASNPTKYNSSILTQGTVYPVAGNTHV